MSSTLTRPAVSGKTNPVFGGGDRPLRLGVYQLAMGTYAVGGESLSAIWDDFKEVLAIFVSQSDVTAADRREFMVDYAGKKLLMYDAFNVEETATSQTAVARIDLLVVGY